MAETTYKKGELLLDENVIVGSADGYNMGTCQTQMRLNQDVLIIEFNETEYECKANADSVMGYTYGGYKPTGPDFSVYPFVLNNMVSGSSLEGAVITDTISLYTENPGTYSLKIYTAIPDSDSDSSSEPVTIRSYINKNLTHLNWNILPQIFESEGMELTEEIERYLKETPKNTNWNMMQTIINQESSEDKSEKIHIILTKQSRYDEEYDEVYTQFTGSVQLDVPLVSTGRCTISYQKGENKLIINDDAFLTLTATSIGEVFINLSQDRKSVWCWSDETSEYEPDTEIIINIEIN